MLSSLAMSASVIAAATPIDPPSDIARAWSCHVEGEQGTVVTDLPSHECHAPHVTWSRTVEVARDLDTPIALALGDPAGDARVIVDGAHVEQSASGVLVVRVPPKAADDGRLDVVVHVDTPRAVIDALPWVDPFGAGPFLVGRSANVAALAHERMRYDQLADNAVSVALSAVFLLVALYHVLVWLMRRSLDGYLWFGVFAFVANVWLTLVAVTGTAMLPLPLEQIGVLSNFVGALTNVAFVEFMWRFLAHARPPRMWRAYQAVLVVVSGLGVVSLQLTVSPVVVLLKVLVPVLALFEIVRFIQKGSPDARVLLAGIVIGALGAPIEAWVESRGIHVPVSPGQAAFGAWMITMASALARQFARTLADVDARNEELKQTNAAVERFVPYEFLRALGKQHVREVERGNGVRTTMTVMFCDLRGFTTLAEKLGPEQTFAFINRYLQKMEPRIHDAGGFINQYLGDGIMALFPTADAAVEAAIGMARAVEQMNEERARAGESAFRIGIGVHTGTVLLGIIGGGDQLDSGVVGDCVNTAARLEGITKMYGATVLVSGDTLHALERKERYALRPLDFVRAKGKLEPLALVEVLDADPRERRARKVEARGRFEQALALYRKGQFADARGAFAALAAEDPDDGAVAALEKRCGELEQAPPSSWDGVLALTQK